MEVLELPGPEHDGDVHVVVQAPLLFEPIVFQVNLELLHHDVRSLLLLLDAVELLLHRVNLLGEILDDVVLVQPPLPQLQHRIVELLLAPLGQELLLVLLGVVLGVVVLLLLAVAPRVGIAGLDPANLLKKVLEENRAVLVIG